MQKQEHVVFKRAKAHNHDEFMVARGRSRLPTS